MRKKRAGEKERWGEKWGEGNEGNKDLTVWRSAAGHPQRKTEQTPL